MSHHVYARLSGYGICVVPRSKYRIAYTNADRKTLRCFSDADGVSLAALLTPNDSLDDCVVELLNDTRLLSDVLDIEAGLSDRRWLIQTTQFDCELPFGYTLNSNAFPHAPGPFDLFGPGSELIFPQTSPNIPDADRLVAEGQTVLRHACDSMSHYIELTYSHDSIDWFQRHDLVDLNGRRYAITTQCKVIDRESALTASSVVVATFSPPNVG